MQPAKENVGLFQLLFLELEVVLGSPKGLRGRLNPLLFRSNLQGDVMELHRGAHPAAQTGCRRR